MVWMACFWCNKFMSILQNTNYIIHLIPGVEIKTRKLEDMQKTEIILVESTTITSIWVGFNNHLF